MIYELEKTEIVSPLFDGFEETLIYSCLQHVMGKIYVTDKNNPKSACAFIGDFAFFAGEPNKELVMNKLKDFIIMVPENKKWEKLIEVCYPRCKRITRYAIKKYTKFDKEKLLEMSKNIPNGYKLRKINETLYDKCLQSPVAKDFVSSFKSKEEFLKKGLGMVILKNEEIVAGASSYTRYKKGIEIEVDTKKEERRKHLATACSAALILECLKCGLYPSWDAANMSSVHLCEKLGYEFSHEYTAYEINL